MSETIARLLQFLKPSSNFQENINHPSPLLSFSGFELEMWEREGIVIDMITPSATGRVKAFSTFWSARTKEPSMTLFPGDRVVVTARQGLLLFVELLEPISPSQSAKHFDMSNR